MKRRLFLIGLVAALGIFAQVSLAYAAGPSVTIKSPATKSTVSGTVKVSASVSGTGITSVVFKIMDVNGPATTMTYNSTSKLYEAMWDTMTSPNVDQTVFVQATNSGGTTTASVGKVTVNNAGGGSASAIVIGYNDLGMHCVCPRPDIMLLLPPYSTLRVQLIERAGTPNVTNDSSKYTVSYNVRENTYGDNGPYDLKKDSNYLQWLDSANFHYPGHNISRTNPVGLTGKGLSGTMDPKTLTSAPGQPKYWAAEGIPAYPPAATDGDWIDAFGVKRKAYMHWDVTAKLKSTGAVVATTKTTLPVAFGGCCTCHGKVAADEGFIKPGASAPDAYDFFQGMMTSHKRDTGVDVLALIGPHYDANGHLTGMDHGVRCSKCHVDAAGGGAAALDSAWVATGKSQGHVTSISPLSKALHLFHATNTKMLTIYDPNVNTDCYVCHPGGNGTLDCYRGHHISPGHTINGHAIWCTDCHGNLQQRISSGQLEKPWDYTTLPACNKSGCHNMSSNVEQLVGTPPVFGRFLGSSGHKRGHLLCSTCHGEPHAEQTSTKAIDNEQNIALQGTQGTLGLGKCNVCHTNKSSNVGQPPHNP